MSEVFRGWWTPELLRRCKFRSARECLECAEQEYRSEMAGLPQLRPEYAARHKAFMESKIAAARASLRKLMEVGL